MKKENNIFIILAIIIVVAILSSGITYFVMNNSNSDDIVSDQGQANEKNTDGVKFKSIEEKNDKIVEEFEITLNGKTTIAKVEFTYYDNGTDAPSNVVIGELNNTLVYTHEYIKLGNNIKKEDIFSKEAIKRTFNTNVFDTIKGQDNKTYLIIYQTGNSNYENKLKVFNDELKLLTKDLFPDYYPDRDGFNINYFYDSPCETGNIPLYANTYTDIGPSYVKKENDKIYFLAIIIDDEDRKNDSGKVEERIYTIKDDKLDYKVLNIYEISGICQAIM